jgi:hypothetical protein
MNKIALKPRQQVTASLWDKIKCALLGHRLAVEPWREVGKCWWWRDAWCQRCGDVLLVQDLKRNSRPPDHGED